MKIKVKITIESVINDDTDNHDSNNLEVIKDYYESLSIQELSDMSNSYTTSAEVTKNENPQP